MLFTNTEDKLYKLLICKNKFSNIFLYIWTLKTVVEDCCEEIKPWSTGPFYYLHIQWCQFGNPWERWNARGGVWAVKGINWVSQSVSWNVTAAGVWAKQQLLLCKPWLGRQDSKADLSQHRYHRYTRPHMYIRACNHVHKWCTHTCKTDTNAFMLLFFMFAFLEISASYWHFPHTNPAFTLSSKSCDAKALIMLNDPISADSTSP